VLLGRWEGHGRMPVPVGKGRKGTISQGMSIFSSWRIRKTNEEDQGRASKHSLKMSKFQQSWGMKQQISRQVVEPPTQLQLLIKWLSV